MFQTLRSRILFYLLLSSMIGILFVSFFMQWGFEESFTKYLDRNREKRLIESLQRLKRAIRKMVILREIQFLDFSMSMR